MINCGTRAGYRKHLRQNEIPCAPCREGRRSYVKDYKIKNLKQYKLSQQTWVENNRDKVRKKNTKWRKNNKEYFLVYGHKRRALKKGLNHSPYTLKEVLDSYGKNCHLCNLPINLQASKVFGTLGWENSLHIDHVIPLARGGSDSLENVRPSHAICNSKKHVKQDQPRI